MHSNRGSLLSHNGKIYFLVLIFGILSLACRIAWATPTPPSQTDIQTPFIQPPSSTPVSDSSREESAGLSGEASFISQAEQPTPAVLSISPTPDFSPVPVVALSGSSTPTPFQPILKTQVADNLKTSVPVETSERPQPIDIGTIEPIPKSEERINILLIGTDRRGGRYFRTDTLIVASIRPGDKLVTLISIPRDLYINIPGHGEDRINTAYLYGELENYRGGGFSLLKDTIKNNLGIPIDHYAMVEFDGFRKIINTLGGIDIHLACPYTEVRKVDSAGGGRREILYTVGPGLVHMDGKLALWYARTRMRTNDFNRGQRQQELLRAIYTQALKTDIIPKVPQLYREFRELVITDLSLRDILVLLPLSLDIGSAQIRNYYINNKLVTPWITFGGASVLLPNRNAIKDMIKEAMGPPTKKEVRQIVRTPVEVWNWSSHPDWGELAAKRLNMGGFRTEIGPPSDEETKKTLLYDLTGDHDPEESEKLLSLLGLRESNLRSDAEGDSEFSYRLVVGNDYDPCFDPATIRR